MPSGGRTGDPHGWNTLDNYLHVHERQMEHLLQIGFVVENLVEIRTQDTPEELGLSGRVRCLHGLFVDVDKVLAVRIQRGRRMVRTVEYSYHVGIEGKRNRPIFRYDNATHTLVTPTRTTSIASIRSRAGESSHRTGWAKPVGRI